MPTPKQVFAKLAARYGQVDPDDEAAVVAFFSERLPKLPRRTIQRVFDELLDADGLPDADKRDAIEQSYPEGVPLPRLDQSPEAHFPAFGTAWIRFLLARVFGSRKQLNREEEGD